MLKNIKILNFLRKRINFILFFILFLLATNFSFASINSTENFDTITNLVNNFYDDSSPLFTNISNNGINGTGAVNISVGNNDVWTSKQGYSVVGAGDKYTISGYYRIASNSGHGGLGITPTINNTTGGVGSPAKGLGFFFHGGGGGFVNNRVTSNVFWSPDLVYTPATWYWVKYEVTALGNNKYDQHFEIWNTDSTGTIGTLKVQGNMNNVTNTDVGSAGTLHGYFSATGSRIDKFDNFSVTLDGNATFINFGTPILTGANINNITTITADTGGNVTSDQGNAITDKGVCYVFGSGFPITTDTCFSSGAGTGAFTTTITGLLPLTTYTVRAYATNSAGTSYGSPQTFTTAYNLIKVGGNAFTVTETGSNTDTMDIVLTATPTTNVVLNISSGSTTAGTVSPSSLTFTNMNWNVPQTITLTAVDNNVLDSSRLYVVNISVDPSSDPAYLAIPTLTVPAQTLDDGDVYVEFSSTASFDAEASGGSFVKLLISALLSSSVTVDLVNLLTGNAASGTDYTFTTPQTITIPAGDYDGTLSTAVSISGLTILDDTIYEGDETINFALQNSTGIKIGDANLDSSTFSNWTYTITNDDATGGGGGGSTTPMQNAYVDAGMVGGANQDTQSGTKPNNDLQLKDVTDPDSLTQNGNSNLSLQDCKPSFPIRAKYNTKNDPAKIKELQKFLNTLGNDLPITGIFHRTNVDAVKKFEKENDLPENGIWGPLEHDTASKISCGWVSPKEAKENREKIEKQLNKNSSSTNTISTSSSSNTANITTSTKVLQRVECRVVFSKRLQIDKPINDKKEVRSLQRFLNSNLSGENDQSIPANGLFGPLTEKYVMKFQEKNGIEKTGIWGANSIKKANQILCGN